MKELIRQFRDLFVSLQLTVVLLAMGIVLIFAATLDQTDLGIWVVQEKYFRSFFVLWQVGDVPVPVFPGGYFVGGMLFINLLASHLYRFKLSWKKSGIFMTHIGLLLLLLGELMSGLWQEESMLTMREGETLNYSESQLKNELAIIDVTEPKSDLVVAIPERALARGTTVQHPDLPFRVETRAYYPNAMLRSRADVPNAPASLATVGLGPQIVAIPIAPTYRPNERNSPAAFVELIGADGSLGTLLVSTSMATEKPDTNGMVLQWSAQPFNYAGRQWKIMLRHTRTYNPFSLTLLKVEHDVYAGTDIPKNFSSRVRINNPGGQGDHESLIYMNNPLRYEGLTFYQSQMAKSVQLTGLQVVRNPSRQLPYISCALMGAGLLIQFGIHLFGFLGKRRKAAAA
ncbi:MAG: hypothetical protein RL324_1346 [Verrucomicrobiota bacterium]|jgi:hypothetical protein